MKLFSAVLFSLFFISFHCSAASSLTSSTTSSQKSSTLSSIAKTSNSSSSLRSSIASSRSTASSTAVSSSIKSSTISASTQSNSSSSNAASSAIKISHVIGPVTLFWRPPYKRENGNNMSAVDLGGYELRYKLANSTEFTYLVIEDPYTIFYIFQWLDGDYIFQVAAYDKAGIYSDFIDIGPAMAM